MNRIGQAVEEETLDRALRLFSTIVAASGDRGLAEIAADLGVPSSTAHRFVATLLRHDMIARIGRGRYCLSYNMAGQGDDERSRQILSRIARPEASALARATRANVHVGVLDNDMVTYLVKAGDQSSLFTREGMQLEAYCSAVGKILLAHLPPSSLDAFLRTGPFIALTSSTIVDPEALRDHLGCVRASQFALDEQEVDEHLRCAAVPIKGSEGRVVAALSISITPPVPIGELLINRLRQSAAHIEARLGGRH